MSKEDTTPHGMVVEMFKHMFGPEGMPCNEAFPDGHGCGCSLKTGHKGPHEAHGSAGNVYHTWES